MGNFFTDNFTGSNGDSINGRTASGGGTWSVHTGTAAVVKDNRMRSAGSASYFFHSAAAQADGESVTGTFVFKSSLTVGLLLRCATASSGSFYMVYWTPGTGVGQLSFWRKKNGSLSQIQVLTAFAPDGADHTIEFKCTGTGASVELSVKFDSGTPQTYSDTNANRLTSLGTAGFVFGDSGSDTTGYHLDSISGDDTYAAAATGTTLTGPTSGNVGEASTDFTAGVTPVGGTITGTLTVTPNDNSGGGSFSPTSVELTTASPTDTFTYTPASAGNKTIGITDDGGLTDPSTITYAASATSAIAISTPVAGRIHQRSGTTGTITVTGTYSGSPGPTHIEARLVQDGTSTPLTNFDWTEKVTTPSAGSYSFSFTSVPQGGWYNVQVRYSNDTGTTATSGAVGVGVLYALTGQSNAYYWFRSRTTTTDPNALVRVYGNVSTWAVPTKSTMAGAIAFGNAIATALTLPVGVLDYGDDNADLYGTWLPTSGTLNRAFTDGVGALDDKLEAVIWIQGEADARDARSGSGYYTNLGTLFADWRAEFSQASLPIILNTLGNYTGVDATDAEWQAIIDAQIQKCGDANIYRVDRRDLALVDTVHHTAAAVATLGTRNARAALYVLGSVASYRGPSISSVVQYSAAVFDVYLTHDMGSDITPSTGITGFRVLDNGTPATISSAVRQSATSIRITLSAPPSQLPVVQYLYGLAPTVTGVVLDNGTLTLPLQGTNAAGVEAIVSTLKVTASIYDPATDTARISQTGLGVLVLGEKPGSTATPTVLGYSATEATDSAGEFTISFDSGGKAPGDLVWLVLVQSDGVPANAGYSLCWPIAAAAA
jgi:hypothetical protein